MFIKWPLTSVLLCHVFWLNTLRPRQNGRHFADAIFKCIFLNEHAWMPIKIALKFVPQGPINNIPTLVQIMAWHRPGNKPLLWPMMVRLPMHICVTRPQWVNEKETKSLANAMELKYITSYMHILSILFCFVLLWFETSQIYPCPSGLLNTLRLRKKATFSQTHFLMHFLERKSMNSN